MANIPANPQVANIFLQAFLGPSDYLHNTVMNYQSGSLTASIADSVTIEIPALTTNQAVNLSNYFPIASNVIFMALYDETLPGQSFGVSTQNGGPFQLISPGGFFAQTPANTGVGTIYVSNPNNTTGVLKIAVMCL